MPYQILESDQNPVWVPDGPVVRGPFSFTFDTPGLEDGIEFYTPTVGDVLLDVWVMMDTLFDGTTPKGSVGNASGSTAGLFFGGDKILGIASVARGDGLQSPDNFNSWRDWTGYNGSGGPAEITAADPLVFWATQDGLRGGTAIGGTTGAARLYIVTATPVAF